jgi:hypothetical protein
MSNSLLCRFDGSAFDDGEKVSFRIPPMGHYTHVVGEFLITGSEPAGTVLQRKPVVAERIEGFPVVLAVATRRASQCRRQPKFGRAIIAGY